MAVSPEACTNDPRFFSGALTTKGLRTGAEGDVSLLLGLPHPLHSADRLRHCFWYVIRGSLCSHKHRFRTTSAYSNRLLTANPRLSAAVCAR